MEYIPTSAYRRFLAMLAASGLKLPETVNLTMDGASREFTVLHKVELSDYPPGQGLIDPVMSITSWAVVPTEGLNVDLSTTEVIDAERDWVKYGHFWVGAVTKVYRDFLLSQDKKLAGFGWCGNSERDLAFASFCLLKAGPLFTTQIKLSSLEMFTPPQQVGGVNEKPRGAVKVGSVDEAGVVTPPPAADGISVELLESVAKEHLPVGEMETVPRISLADAGDSFFGTLSKKLFQQNQPETAVG